MDGGGGAACGGGIVDGGGGAACGGGVDGGAVCVGTAETAGSGPQPASASCRFTYGRIPSVSSVEAHPQSPSHSGQTCPVNVGPSP
ncbi:hypothetical protein GCM10010393_02530 [Streptomyces gobitricini]|uniref:Uncharacterized protein n=1 Tax=Streptomyces gobitricini TaxID=68211 RepID=A0ABN3L1I5_9ACTN